MIKKIVQVFGIIYLFTGIIMSGILFQIDNSDLLYLSTYNVMAAFFAGALIWLILFFAMIQSHNIPKA